jgi:hypothetical protein
MKKINDDKMSFIQDILGIKTEMGVAFRIQDKASRMQNLLLKELKGESSINHESLEDTYLDAANYCLIALLLKRGLWE